jgi:hypothetical protein
MSICNYLIANISAIIWLRKYCLSRPENSFRWEGKYRGGNEERIGLGDRLAQQIDQRVVDACVADTSRSEKKLHKSCQ